MQEPGNNVNNIIVKSALASSVYSSIDSENGLRQTSVTVARCNGQIASAIRMKLHSTEPNDPAASTTRQLLIWELFSQLRKPANGPTFSAILCYLCYATKRFVFVVPVHTACHPLLRTSLFVTFVCKSYS